MDYRLNQHSRLIQAIRHCNVRAVDKVLASILNSEDCYKLLTKQSRSGQYPLHYTLRDMSSYLNHTTNESNTRLPVAQAILEQIDQTNKLKYLQLQDSQGRTALYTAAISGEKDVIEFYLSELSVIEQLELISVKDNHQLNVLESTVSEDIKKLINSYINASDAEELTKKKSVLKRTKVGSKPKEEAIITSSYDKTSIKSSRSSRKQQSRCYTNHLTPDNMMSQYEHLIDIVKSTQDYEDVFHLKDSAGRTLLHLAAQGNRHDIVEKLLLAVENKFHHWKLLSFRCKTGKTALHYACMVNSVEIAKTLLEFSREQDVALTRIEDNEQLQAIKYAKHHQLTKLLPMVETHYWRLFYKRPKAFIFYNRFLDYKKWKRDGAEAEKCNVAKALEQYNISSHIHVDFSERTMLAKLEQGIKNDGHISGLILVIMSHGERATYMIVI
ncbi:hypothetical protein EB796_002479 [Bugula neritina]|uniref:Caspase family p20 domain-containing protein n=1 Tax=Bugula neritina TaxID=10212 RepID=A0A7J7KM33_BUGNE|nr:hypothetical protein EB796_002479 [Bugula neritina]